MKTSRIYLMYTAVGVLIAFNAVKVSAQNVELNINSQKSYAVTSTVNVSANVAGKVTTTTGSSTVQEPTVNDAEKSKSFSKSFSVDNNDKVNVVNQYGSITIKTWDKKEVRVDIDIKAYSNSDNDAQKLIDQVSIDATKSGDAVSIKTVMGDGNGNYGRKVKNGVITWRRELKVNYVLYMPASNALTVAQEYGNVDMGNFSGSTSLKVEYGNLTAGNLSNSNNYINVQYGKTDIQDLNAAVIKHEYGGGVTIGSIGTLQLSAEYVPVNIGTVRRSADIKVEYGAGLTVGTIAGNLLLTSEYAKVNIARVKGNTVIKQGYANLTIGSVGKLNLKTEYTTVSLGTINGDATINMDYNNLAVNQITTACRNFIFNGEYVTAVLGFSSGYNANFAVSASYSGFNSGSKATSTNVSKDDETKRYTGKIGTGGTAVVNAKVEYGSVTFK